MNERERSTARELSLPEAAQRLIEAALSSDFAYRRLGYLCDRIGHRLSCSEALARAIVWAEAELRRDGLERVHTQKVLVPHWVRGKESAALVSPVRKPLVMLGLGGSVGESVEAPVLVVASFEELTARASEARGKIVCFNVAFTTYGQTVRFRSGGASEAARVGAVAALVRSVGPTSLRTPHTGALRYAPGVAPIPAAALTLEDATLLERLQARGDRPVVQLTMEARTLPDVPSANVLAEWRGREKPHEIVLLGGHLDSWDVGQGAHDDGGGCLACWEALRLMKQLGLRPRRTVRLCLFTNEENGTRGGMAYRDQYRSEPHVLALEADGGVGAPTGFGLSSTTPGGRERARQIARALETLGASEVKEGGGGTDIGPLGETGVPTMGLQNDMSLYWSIHHTPADTFDKIDPLAFQKCVAAVAVMAYGAADHPERL